MPARSKRIIDIESRELPDGGANVSCRMNYQADTKCAATAVVKAVLFLNEYCKRQDLGVSMKFIDPKTGGNLSVSFSEPFDG